MFRSIAEDVKSAFDYGNMLVKLIIINIVVFVVTALLNAFLPEIYANHILPYLALPGELHVLLYRPWTLLTHMFLHQGLWHLIGNMITLYWFGNIAGDLLGDRKILPVYLLGGLMGALFYIVSYQMLPQIGIYALGASAACLAIVFTAVATAPDYVVHLILVGPVRIKYIGLFILFLDIIGTAGNSNTGGHLAHLGGTLFGFLFVWLLRNGTDISSWFYRSERPKQKPVSRLKVAHKADVLTANRSKVNKTELSTKVDQILEKIKSKGYSSLSDEEKEVLYQASKE